MRRRLGLILATVALAAITPRAHGQYVETIINVGPEPYALLWNPVSDKVYCTTVGYSQWTVAIISGSTNEVLTTLEVAEEPKVLAWNPAANKVYVGCWDSKYVYVVDGVGDTVIRRVHVSVHPDMMEYSVTSNKLYVAERDENHIAVLDGTTDEVIANVRVEYVASLLWHPFSNRLLCRFWLQDSVCAIDCTTDEVVSRVGLPGETGYAWVPWCLNMTTGLAYLPTGPNHPGLVYVFNPAGDSVVATIPVPCWELCAVPFPNKLYAAWFDGNDDSLFVIDGGSHLVTGRLGVGGFKLACDTAIGKVYCTDYGLDSVYVLDARADTVVKSFYVDQGTWSGGLAWNQTDHRLYVPRMSDSSVCVIRDAVGVAEPGAARTIGDARLRATMVKDVLQVYGDEPAVLMDVCGRTAAELRPGPNDARRLPPGVYVIRAKRGGILSKVTVLR